MRDPSGAIPEPNALWWCRMRPINGHHIGHAAVRVARGHQKVVSSSSARHASRGGRAMATSSANMREPLMKYALRAVLVVVLGTSAIAQTAAPPHGLAPNRTTRIDALLQRYVDE